jgi:hypothetical protein
MSTLGQKALNKILKAYPEKDIMWAETQLIRALNNTDIIDPTEEQYNDILESEFNITRETK